jgi:two-component system cell cycle response regulator DivK
MRRKTGTKSSKEFQMSSKKTILYVEDDANSRKVMSVLVNTLDSPLDLIIFEDSSKFLERIDALENTPDLILLDIHVTPYDGFSMLKMLREQERYAKQMVIALTASVMNEEINKLKEAGFDGVLGKPLNFASFPDRMKRILAGERIWSIFR